MTITLERSAPASGPLGESGARPRIVCLCGSTKFASELARENARLTALGHIVLAPAGVGLERPSPLWATPEAVTALEERLDRVHRDKIALAHEVVVVCPGDYIGDSVRAEIEAATELGKPITYLSTARPRPGEPVFVERFATLLRDVRPHIDPDTTLPLLHGARLEAGAGRLVAVATNRFTLAAAHRDVPGIGRWNILIPHRTVAAVLEVAHAAGTDDARLEHSQAGLTIRIGGHALVVDDHHLGEYPQWRPKVARALSAGPALTTEILLDRRMLGLFADVGPFEDGTVQVWGSDPHEPVAITRGLDYVGLLMPKPRGNGRTGEPSLDAVRAAWNVDPTVDSAGGAR